MQCTYKHARTQKPLFHTKLNINSSLTNGVFKIYDNFKAFWLEIHAYSWIRLNSTRSCFQSKKGGFCWFSHQKKPLVNVYRFYFVDNTVFASNNLEPSVCYPYIHFHVMRKEHVRRTTNIIKKKNNKPPTQKRTHNKAPPKMQISYYSVLGSYLGDNTKLDVSQFRSISFASPNFYSTGKI